MEEWADATAAPTLMQYMIASYFDMLIVMLEECIQDGTNSIIWGASCIPLNIAHVQPDHVFLQQPDLHQSVLL